MAVRNLPELHNEGGQWSLHHRGAGLGLRAGHSGPGPAAGDDDPVCRWFTAVTDVAPTATSCPTTRVSIMRPMLLSARARWSVPTSSAATWDPAPGLHGGDAELDEEVFLPGRQGEVVSSNGRGLSENA